MLNAATHVKGSSAILGMPILAAGTAKPVIMNKRSMAGGSAGLDIEPSHMGKP